MNDQDRLIIAAHAAIEHPNTGTVVALREIIEKTQNAETRDCDIPDFLWTSAVMLRTALSQYVSISEEFVRCYPRAPMTREEGIERTKVQG